MSVMSVPPVYIQRKISDVTLPKYSSEGAAGLDLYAGEDKMMQPGEHATVRSGIAMSIPKGYVGLIWDKSGVALKGIKVMGGVIDADFRGEITFILKNVTDKPIEIKKNTKATQMIFHKVEQHQIIESESLDETVRGEGKFGSTGLH